MLQASYIILEDLDSLKSSLKAATIKNHKPLLYLSENTKEGEIPQVSYHGKCISQTTDVKQFLNLESEAQSRTYSNGCTFCKKKTAHKKVQEDAIL